MPDYGSLVYSMRHPRHEGAQSVKLGKQSRSCDEPAMLGSALSLGGPPVEVALKYPVGGGRDGLDSAHSRTQVIDTHSSWNGISVSSDF